MQRDPKREPHEDRDDATPKDPEEVGALDRAAPPDDGGHTGSFTRPEDVLEVGGESTDERRPRREAPDLHWSPRTGAQRRPSDEPPQP